jgi:hypothetical protein
MSCVYMWCSGWFFIKCSFVGHYVIYFVFQNIQVCVLNICGLCVRYNTFDVKLLLFIICQGTNAMMSGVVCDYKLQILCSCCL